MELISNKSMNTEEKADKRLAVRVTQTVKDAFNERARKSGKTESQALLALVSQFIGGELEIESDINTRLQRLEEEIKELKQARSGELIASGTRIAS
jgi:cell division septum initiation protein DivIVA